MRILFHTVFIDGIAIYFDVFVFTEFTFIMFVKVDA